MIYPIETSYFTSNRFCSDQGEVMWVMNIKRSPRERTDCSPAGQPGVPYCPSFNFEQLRGWDTLDGTQWGGLNRAEFVTAAVRVWKHNDKKNGWESADPTTPQGQNEIMEQGLKAMGMVNIPVCSFEEAIGNAWPGIETDNWPCN